MDTLREENSNQEGEALFDVGDPVVAVPPPELPPEQKAEPEEDRTEIMVFSPPLAGATISPCGKYRYLLWRKFKASGKSLLWIMLNPSTADASMDDPTIRRICAFSKREGAAEAVVCNLFAYRATDPKKLSKVVYDLTTDPYGPDNSKTIGQQFVKHETCVVAWGSNGWINRSGEKLLASLEFTNETRADGKVTKIMCLGVTKAGHPRHPLYVSRVAALTPFQYQCKIDDDRQEDF